VQQVLQPFIYHAPTKIQFAEGLAGSVAEACQEMGATSVLLVVDGALVKNGLIDPILAGFDDINEISLTTFSEVVPDSELDCVNKALELGRDNNCDAILAVGGGSALDTAKVVNIGLSLPGDIVDYQGLNNLSERLFPMIAVPTTAGTGSEVSMVAMVKDKLEGKKLFFGSRFLAPDIAILDPALLVSLPSRLTAACGLDAVTHDIEAYSVALTASPITDILCLESLKLLFEYLPHATKCGADLEARSHTLVASTMAGIAFTNTGVGIVHALAHAVGGKFGTHHGMTNAVFLPYGMQFNLDLISSRYAAMARYMKFSDSRKDEVAAKHLIERVEKLTEELGLPRQLRALGIPTLSEEQFLKLADLASCDPAMIFNPKEATIDDLLGVCQRAY
jgi:alcohol dehydrogenase class IV